jgi:hypothetical protein
VHPGPARCRGHARAEILLDALDRLRRSSLEERRPELDVVCAVIDPGPARLEPPAEIKVPRDQL